MPHLTPRPRKSDRPDRPTRWLVTWDLPASPNGERRRVTETVRGTKRDAIQRMEEREAEIRAGGKGYAQPSKQTLTEYMGSWLRTHVDTNLRPSTADSYHQIVDLHIVPGLGGTPLADLTAHQIQTWLTNLLLPQASGRTLSPRRVAYIRQVLHAALADAVRLGLLPANPVDRVRPPKQNPKQVQSFTREQAQAIDEAGADGALGVLFSFLWRTGLRIGEAMGLRWSDINLEDGSLSVHRTVARIGGRVIEGPPKTKAGRRDIALPPQVVEMLRLHKEAQELERQAQDPDWNPLGLVFPSVTGTWLAYGTVRWDWMKLLRRAGLPAYGLHALRHTCASLMLQAGVGIAEIAAHLGDDPAIVSRVYAHILEQTKRQAADRFAQFLDGSQVP